MSKKIVFNTIYKKDADGNIHNIPALKGQGAQDGVSIDNTLTDPNKAAPANVVGELNDEMSYLQNNGETPVEAGKVWTTTDDGAEWKTPAGGSFAGLEVGGIDVQPGADGKYNIPAAANYGGYGVVKISANQGIGLSNGALSPSYASNALIDSRSAKYPIGCGNLDYAVKSAMCDGKGAAWDEPSMQAGRERLGLGTIKDDIATLNNDEKTAAAGQVWTATEDGAEWKTPTGGAGGGVTDVQVNGKSVVENGVATIPIAKIDGINAPLGLVGVRSSGYSEGIDLSNGILKLRGMSDGQAAGRGNAMYGFIPKQTPIIVKSAMTSTSDTAWTAEEQAAGRARLGIGEIEYIDTVTLEEDTNVFVYNLDKYYRYLDVYVSQNAVETKYNGSSRIAFSDSATAKSEMIIQTGQNLSASLPNLHVTAEHAVDINNLTVSIENSMNNVTSYQLYQKTYGIRGENPETSKIAAIRPFNRISTTVAAWKAGTVFYIRGVRA